MPEVVFTDRYDALGIPAPDVKTMCKGQCEGVGWVPMLCREDNVTGLLFVEDENEDQRLVDLWRQSHEESHTLKGILKAAWSLRMFGPWSVVSHLWRGWKCDGWHFVKCPDCGGTGRLSGADED